MNLVTLIGRLTADPELKFFSSGTAISKGTVAIDRSYKKDNQTVTDFIPVEVWGKQAEYFATCFQKGYLIAVSGQSPHRPLCRLRWEQPQLRQNCRA